MKQILITLLFLSFLYQGTYSQYKSLDDFLIRETLDQGYELIEIDDLKLEQSDSIKKPLVEKLKDFTHFDHLVNRYNYFKEEFKTIDLDKDGLLDIFYSGYLGGAADSYSYIFINSGDGFVQEFYGMMGSFIKSVKLNDGSLGLIYSYDGPAADCPELSRLDLIFFKDSYQTIQTLVEYPNDTKKPEEYFKQPIRFKVKNEKYYLRSRPEINNTNYKFCDIIGNIHHTYKTGDKGSAFAEETDETGRVWWYVIMNNGIAGWMSSRYLEKKHNK